MKIMVRVERPIVVEFEVDYYKNLEEVIKFQYHSEHNIVFLFKYYWYDATVNGIKVDLHHGLIKINTKARLHNVNNINKFIAHNFGKDHSKID
jgi:hypothetical protein